MSSFHPQQRATSPQQQEQRFYVSKSIQSLYEFCFGKLTPEQMLRIHKEKQVILSQWNGNNAFKNIILNEQIPSPTSDDMDIEFDTNSLFHTQTPFVEKHSCETPYTPFLSPLGPQFIHMQSDQPVVAPVVQKEELAEPPLLQLPLMQSQTIKSEYTATENTSVNTQIKTEQVQHNNSNFANANVVPQASNNDVGDTHRIDNELGEAMISMPHQTTQQTQVVPPSPSVEVAKRFKEEFTVFVYTQAYDLFKPNPAKDKEFKKMHTASSAFATLLQKYRTYIEQACPQVIELIVKLETNTKISTPPVYYELIKNEDKTASEVVVDKLQCMLTNVRNTRLVCIKRTPQVYHYFANETEALKYLYILRILRMELCIREITKIALGQNTLSNATLRDFAPRPNRPNQTHDAWLRQLSILFDVQPQWNLDNIITFMNAQNKQ